MREDCGVLAFVHNGPRHQRGGAYGRLMVVGHDKMGETDLGISKV